MECVDFLPTIVANIIGVVVMFIRLKRSKRNTFAVGLDNFILLYMFRLTVNQKCFAIISAILISLAASVNSVMDSLLFIRHSLHNFPGLESIILWGCLAKTTRKSSSVLRLDSINVQKITMERRFYL